MARVTAISGLGHKSAAVFLLHDQGRRILLDLGEGINAGEHPDLSRVGNVDAVILSHSHVDHAGSLYRLDEIGTPPVYATAATLNQAGAVSGVVLPENGCTEVAGIPVRTGRAGHAPGGVWVHFPTVSDGFLYTGDYSTEALALPFDPFPRAKTVLCDASYGDRNISLCDQITEIADLIAHGAVLPCPAWGRGPDMVSALRRGGLTVYACPQIAIECSAVGVDVSMVTAITARPTQVIIT